jgi:hypothetical protein
LIHWKWLSVRESWWYPLRQAWITWGLPVCCGCHFTSVGSTEARLRARETCEENEILWLPLHVGNPGFLLLVYYRFLTLSNLSDDINILIWGGIKVEYGIILVKYGMVTEQKRRWMKLWERGKWNRIRRWNWWRGYFSSTILN